MILHLVRHPRPLSVENLCYGRRDVPVTAQSLADTVTRVRQQLAAATLADAAVFTSPATRCVVLARALAAPRQPVPVDDLQELDFGTWEGRSWDAVPRDELDAWAGDVWSYRPGGAESAALVAERWRRWVRWLRHAGTGNTVAVTHAGVIRVALHCCGGLTGDAFARAVIEYGSVHRIDLGAGRFPA